MTSEEEALLSEVKDIINTASENDDKQYDDYCVEVAKEVEQAIWNNSGALESYEVYTLSMRQKGTPEEMAQLKADNPEIQSLVVQPNDMEVNSCIELAIGYTAEMVDLPDLNALLTNHQAMLMLSVREDKELVGLVARTGAWASPSLDARPSQSEDRKSVTITIYMCAGRMVVLTRDDATGELMPETQQVIRYFRPEKPDDKGEMAECANYLLNTYGKVAANLYCAWAYPRVIKMVDPELVEAMKKDALSSSDDESTEQ